jgi:hypothetical protein
MERSLRLVNNRDMAPNDIKDNIIKLAKLESNYEFIKNAQIDDVSRWKDLKDDYVEMNYRLLAQEQKLQGSVDHEKRINKLETTSSNSQVAKTTVGDVLHWILTIGMAVIGLLTLIQRMK